MKFKKLTGIILSGIIATSSIAALAAEENNKITVNLNGVQMQFDVDPIVENDRTLVPFRAIFEALDCAVSYQKLGEFQYVRAERGADSVLLQIGENKMLVNGEEVLLDTPPKIINDRTLVPLRAVSESLDCSVKWLGDIKTVCLYKKLGQYEITSEHINKSVKSDDGTELINISCAYPILKADGLGSFARDINRFYKQKAEDFVSEAEKEYKEGAEAEYKEKGADDFLPMEFCMSYEVNTNRKDKLSITVYDYRDTNGAHPNYFSESKTYDMANKKEMSLNEIMNISDSELSDTILDIFTNVLEESNVEVTSEISKAITDEAKNVEWYFTDNSVVLYFNPYQIGAYALGSPAAEIAYEGNEDNLNVDLSEADMDKFEFELDGNETTGYKWEIRDASSDKLKIESEYVPDKTEKDIAGSGGKYKFTVTGIDEGNAAFDLVYTQGDDSTILKTVEYDLYVSKDNKITVLSKSESINEEEDTTIVKMNGDIMFLSNGEEYLLGEAFIYDKSVKSISCTDLTVGDQLRYASEGDNLVFVRNNKAEGFEADKYKIIKIADDDLIEFQNGEVFITGEALLYEADSSVDYKTLKAGDKVKVLTGDDDLVVVIKK